MSKKAKSAAALAVIQVPLTKILPDPQNHRNTLNEDADKELASSIKVHGILQPITARPCTNDKRFDYYVVCGHRRLRAAKIAKLDTVPVIVRDIAENDVLEIQVLENLQREDVSPMDEANAFATLLAKESIDWLASKIHKSKKYIQDRLKLVQLNTVAQRLLAMGKLPLGHAVMISKLQPEDQIKALDMCFPTIDFSDVAENDDDDYIGSYCEKTQEDLRDDIEDIFATFSKANFDPADDTLDANAGACTACIHRTGNNQLLFEDITDEDRCANTACFKQKTMLHLKRAELLLKQETGDKVVKAELNSMNSRDRSLKVNGHNTGFSEKPAKGLTPVLITKTDSYTLRALGKIVYVDMKQVQDEKAGKKKETSKMKEARVDHAREKFYHKEVPRIQKYLDHIKSTPLGGESDLLRMVVADRLQNARIENLVMSAIIFGIDIGVNEDLVYEFVYDLKMNGGWDRMQEYRQNLVSILKSNCTPRVLAHILLLNDIEDSWDDYAEGIAIDLDADEHDITLEKVWALTNFKP